MENERNQPNKTTAQDRQRSGLSGELFAAAELAKRGYTVSITFGNTKAIDLLIEKNGRTLALQVKTITRTKSHGWPLPPKEEKIPTEVPFIFVVLNEIDVPPDYYIVDAEYVIQKSWSSITRRTLSISKVRDYKSAWHRIDEFLQRDSIA